MIPSAVQRHKSNVQPVKLTGHTLIGSHRDHLIPKVVKVPSGLVFVLSLQMFACISTYKIPKNRCTKITHLLFLFAATVGRPQSGQSAGWMCCWASRTVGVETRLACAEAEYRRGKSTVFKVVLIGLPTPPHRRAKRVLSIFLLLTVSRIFVYPDTQRRRESIFLYVFVFSWVFSQNLRCTSD